MPPPLTVRRLSTALAILTTGLWLGSVHAAEPPEPKTFKGHDGWVGGVALNADGSRLVTASADKTAIIWDVAKGKALHTLKGHEDYVACVAFSRDGKLIATGSYDHSAKLWDAGTGELKETFKGHRGAVMSVGFRRDDGVVATGSIDGTIRFPGVGYQLTGHRSWVNAVAFSPHAKTLASAGSDGTVILWGEGKRDEVAGKRHVLNPKAAEIRSLAYSPDGKMLAAGTRYGIVKVWSEKGEEVASLKNKHGGDVWGVAFAPDGKTLASVDGEWNKPSDVVLWDTTTWKERARLKHTNEVLCLAFARDKPILAAGAWDKTTKVWDLSAMLNGEK